MAKFVALDMQAFLFQEEIRYTNVTYTFLKDGSVSALKKRVVSSFFGNNLLSFSPWTRLLGVGGCQIRGEANVIFPGRLEELV